MIRSLTTGLLATLMLLAAGGAAQVAAANSTSSQLHIAVPAQVDAGSTAAISVSLPAGVAAVDGRIFFDTANAEVAGVAPVGRGQALDPQQISGGFAFGVYDMRASGGKNEIRIAVVANSAGRLPFRIVLDTAADASGAQLALGAVRATGSVVFGSSSIVFAQPADAAPRQPLRAAGLTRDLVPDGRLAVTDLDIARAAWEQSELSGNPCASDTTGGDANGDGCVNIADVQAVLAHQSWSVSSGLAVSAPSSASSSTTNAAAAVAPNLTFTVNSTADTVDVNNGDGICADSQGRCTLRAAISEANWDKGNNTINFNLPGTAPVTIQLLSSLPQFVLQDRTGGTLIDGYSQPGSRVNTAANGSNAIPGVYLVGTGNSPSLNGFRITSASNTVRGIVFNKFDRTFVMDGTDAHDNVIAGDWLNYNRDGSASSFKGHYNVWISNGANHNHLGTPALADRNVSGNATKGSALYGPGTDSNDIQNNDFCMTPSGTSVATCDVGTDFTFGPKHNLIGGSDPGDGNVYGASTQQCIEFAHDDGIETSDEWHNNSNSIIGNWLGFRADGSYSSAFRCGSNTYNSGSNDSNGINLADGSGYNLVQDNYIASWYDGVNIMMPNETGNVVLDNTIGVSPLGQAAPLLQYGVHFRTHAKGDQVIGNTISNAAVYGIALMGSDIANILISHNVITNMTGAAIHLDTGANNKITPPVIKSGTTVQVTGTAEAGTTIEVYKASLTAGSAGLPIAFVGQGVTGTNGTWTAPVAGLQSGDRVTALQIRPDQNTSALAKNVTVSQGQVPPAPTADFSWSQPSALNVTFTDASTGTISQWAWDFGDGASSSAQNPSHTYATAGTYSVKLTVTNAGGSTSKTRQVTVQAAPPPPPPNTVVSDAFARTVNGGWGSADTGGKYTVQGTAADYGVASGKGTMTVTSAGDTRYALLNTPTARDIDIVFRVAVDKVASGGNYIVYAVARRNSTNEYRPRIQFLSNGSVAVGASVVINNTETILGAWATVSGLTQSANGYIWVHAQVSGTSPTTIKVRAWADGTTEPGTWQYTATDSTAAVQAAGSLGLRLWVAKAATTAPITFSFDDYSVVGS